jgi:tetratricopeptide (TPR) repeat protein
MKSSKVLKGVKRKNPISTKKVNINNKKQTKLSDMSIKRSPEHLRQKINSKESEISTSNLPQEKPAMMSTEEIMNRIEKFENRVAEQGNKGESFTVSFAEVADLVDNVFLYHTDSIIFLRLATFIFKFFAQADESFYEVASKLLQASLIADPDNFLSHYWQGKFHEFQSNNAKARASYETSLQLRPSGKAYTALGLLYGKEGNFREALKVLLKAIELDPEDTGAMVSIGSVYLGYEKIEAALKWTQKAIDINPNNLDALLQCAFLLSENRQIKECLEVYEKALLVYPDNPTIYERMSDAYLDLEEMDKALDCINKAFKLDPNNVQIINRAGQFAMNQENDIDKAIKLFLKGIELNPKDSISYNNMGIALTEKEELEKAKSYYLKAISLSPESSDPRLNYAQVLNQEGNAVEAIATLQGFKPTQKRDKELIEQILHALKEQVKKEREQTWDIE